MGSDDTDQKKKESIGKKIAGAPLRGLIKLGNWERKQIDNLRANRAKQKELDSELKVFEDEAFKEEAIRLAKKRGRQKAKNRGSGILGGINLRMPDLMEGMDDPLGLKKKKKAHN